MRTRLIVIALIASTTFVYAQSMTEEDFAKQTKEHTVDVDKSVSTAVGKTNIGVANSSKYQAFGWEFKSSWSPNSLHWDPPSTFVINNDGSWHLYAAHLANMRRTGGIFDTGDTYSYGVNVRYWSQWDAATETCKGAVIHSSDYQLTSLGYKNERWNVGNSGTDEAFAQVVSQAACASLSRWMR